MSDYVIPRTRISISQHAPEASRALLAFNKAVTPHIDPVLAELVKIRASQLNHCAYCVDMHTRDAVAAGEDQRRVSGIVAWHESPFFTARERAALALTDAVTLIADTHVPDDVWEQAEKEFDPEELAHLVLAITAINTLNRIAVTSRMLPQQ